MGNLGFGGLGFRGLGFRGLGVYGLRGGFGFRVWDLISTILRVWGFLILSVESFMYLLSVFWVAVSYVGFAGSRSSLAWRV